MFKEFKEFVAKGDVIMLAVGFIMGVAFQSVVTSLVENVIMPIVAIPFGEPNFDALQVEVGESIVTYGAFITTLVVFVLTALAVFFFIVKPYNAYKRRFGEEVEDETPGPTELEVLTEIRDTLRTRSI